MSSTTRTRTTTRRRARARSVDLGHGPEVVAKASWWPERLRASRAINDRGAAPATAPTVLRRRSRPRAWCCASASPLSTGPCGQHAGPNARRHAPLSTVPVKSPVRGSMLTTAPKQRALSLSACVTMMCTRILWRMTACVTMMCRRTLRRMRLRSARLSATRCPVASWPSGMTGFATWSSTQLLATRRRDVGFGSTSWTA